MIDGQYSKAATNLGNNCSSTLLMCNKTIVVSICNSRKVEGIIPGALLLETEPRGVNPFSGGLLPQSASLNLPTKICFESNAKHNRYPHS